MWLTQMYNTTKLTVELREIVDSVENSEDSVDIWDFDYPSFYKGEEKKAFERKVIDHYYFRQIGQETVGRFVHCFRTRIREIMPYYIRMYESVKLMDELDNPFDNVDVTETFEEQTTGRASGESSGSATSTQSTNQSENTEHRFSNTPQGSISNLDSYMTEASRDNNSSQGTGNSSSESTGTSSNESSGTTTHTLTRKGNQGVNTYAHDIMEYRQSLIDVDMMIINNLQDLFLGVY